MTKSAVPEGYHTLTPYFFVKDPEVFLAFLKAAFDGEVTECMRGEDGQVQHAEVRVGDSMLMLSPAKGEYPPMPASVYMYVADADTTYQRALDAGGVSLMEPADMFYGDRNAGVRDPLGNLWWMATRKENVPSDELARRAKTHMKH